MESGEMIRLSSEVGNDKAVALAALDLGYDPGGGGLALDSRIVEHVNGRPRGKTNPC